MLNYKYVGGDGSIFAVAWNQAKLDQKLIQKNAKINKWVCDPYKLRAPSSCLVYSIGTDGKYEFENNVHKKTGTDLLKLVAQMGMQIAMQIA